MIRSSVIISKIAIVTIINGIGINAEIIPLNIFSRFTDFGNKMRFFINGFKINIV